MIHVAVERSDMGKFQDPDITAQGETRASVALTKLETLWFNTGTLCNLECGHCYIESSPRNGRENFEQTGKNCMAEMPNSHMEHGGRSIRYCPVAVIYGKFVFQGG